VSADCTQSYSHSTAVAKYEIYLDNSLHWLQTAQRNSIHAVVTDPPYTVVDFSPEELKKMRAGSGGIWRLPPTIGGSKRKPLPRFTVLTNEQLNALSAFFEEWGQVLYPSLVPGAHVAVASNPFVSPWVQLAMYRAGFEVRGQIIRLYRTFRGGDRPKNREKDFPHLQTTLRGAHEPWLLFRKPIEQGLTVAENLEKWGAGALKRADESTPFADVVPSGKTPKEEFLIGAHPTQKPIAFLLRLVSLLTPCPGNILLDPFMGSGSTIAAAASLGYFSIGIEVDEIFYRFAKSGIPKLIKIASRTALQPELI